MALIKLSQGKYTIVDKEDVKWLSEYGWFYHKGYVACRNTKHSKWPNPPTQLYMHRLLAKTPNGLFTDHINRNPLDNRKDNLRVVTNRENQLNKKERSGYGVSWHKRAKKWRADIRVNGKRIWLGQYNDLEDAKKAYSKARRCYT